jgi:NAD(P)-dependent dehydrogenase (short-subunit alcohol dehydrogenase family)
MIVEEMPESVDGANEILKAAMELGRVGGVFDLRPLDWSASLDANDPTGIIAAIRSSLVLANTFARALEELGDAALGFLFATHPVSRGSRDRAACPLAAGVRGLAKSLARELEKVAVRVVAVEPDPLIRGLAAEMLSAETLAEQLLAEQLDPNAPVESRLSGTRRYVTRCKVESAGSGPDVLDDQSVVLLTGGARGITAELAVALGRRFRPTLILVGRTRTPAAEEAADTRGMVEPAQLKAALRDLLAASGKQPDIREIETAYHELLKEREVRANLARIRETGARVWYASVDVCDDQALETLITDIYERCGRLDGVVHGAGVLEDSKIESKEVASFERVLRTKVCPALTLARSLRPEGLRFLVYLTSVAGVFGNAGQADYAAANEILAEHASQLDRIWPTRVFAIAWGPWDGMGMVREHHRRALQRAGVSLVQTAAAQQLFLDELGAPGPSEVVIAALAEGERAL